MKNLDTLHINQDSLHETDLTSDQSNTERGHEVLEALALAGELGMLPLRKESPEELFGTLRLLGVDGEHSEIEATVEELAGSDIFYIKNRNRNYYHIEPIERGESDWRL